MLFQGCHLAPFQSFAGGGGGGGEGWGAAAGGQFFLSEDTFPSKEAEATFPVLAEMGACITPPPREGVRP